MTHSSDPLVVDIVRTLEDHGLPRDEYQLACEFDPEALERLVDSADRTLEVRVTVRGIPLLVTSAGAFVVSEQTDDCTSDRADDSAVETDSGDESPFPDCPRCGTPVLRVVTSGPGRHTARPCGCRVHYDRLDGR